MAFGTEKRHQRHPRDFPPRGVLLTGAALAGTLLALAALLLLFQHAALEPISRRDTRPAPAASPLQEGEFEAGEIRRKIDDEALSRLGSYGWVDREKGLVHIPIRRAMEIRAAHAGKGGKK